MGSSFYISIENFESFLWNLNLSANNLFWRYDMLYGTIQMFMYVKPKKLTYCENLHPNPKAFPTL